MVTIISNPTTSFRLSIPSVRNASASTSNFQTTNCLIGSTSSTTTKRLLFQSQNQLKLGFRFRRLDVSCGVTEINQSQFPETVLSSELPVLVEFVADWCGPCRLISPAIEWASKEYEDKLKIVKINHDLNPQLIAEYKVYGLPALIFFKNGQEVRDSRREGAMTQAKLKEYIDAHLELMAVI